MTTSTTIPRAEDTGRSPLDPRDWNALADLGGRMVTDLLEYLRTIGEGPVWRPLPGEVRRAFEGPPPESGSSADVVYDEFLRDVLPWNMGNVHPRFWG